MIDKKAQANIDVRDLEKFVFQAYSNTPNNQNKKSGNQDQSLLSYQEEESYVNPPLIECHSELFQDYEDQ